MFRSLVVSICMIAVGYSTEAQVGTRDSVHVIRDTSELKVFEKVEVEASFPGGDMAWREFLEKNLRANTPVDNGAPVGRYTVWVQFVVDKTGNVSDIKALSNNGFGMEQEVIRIIQRSAQWQPASQDGRMVKAYRKQPVTFMVEDDGFKIGSNEPYVLYSGVDNPITIITQKVKPEDLQVTISQGTIFPKGNGNYTVRVPKTGRVVIHLFNKRNKEIGAASFEVKPKQQSFTRPEVIKG